MPILNRPMSPEEFDNLEFNRDKGRANSLISHLNYRLKSGELSVTWGDKPEDAKMIEIVDKVFKEMGWGGVAQKVIADKNVITVERKS